MQPNKNKLLLSLKLGSEISIWIGALFTALIFLLTLSQLDLFKNYSLNIFYQTGCFIWFIGTTIHVSFKIMENHKSVNLENTKGDNLNEK